MLRSSVLSKVVLLPAVVLVGVAFLALQPGPAHAQFTYLETWSPEYTPPANPVPCDTLHEIYPDSCKLWHVLKWEKVAGQYHGGAVLEKEPFPVPDDSLCYRFFDVVIMTVEDLTPVPAFGPMTTEGEAAFGPTVLDPPIVSTQWHVLLPKSMYSQRFHVDDWKDGQPVGQPGNGVLSACDTLIIAWKPSLVDKDTVHVIKVVTGAKISPAEQVPGLSRWGVGILVALLVFTAAWLIRRRRRFATLAA